MAITNKLEEYVDLKKKIDAMTEMLNVLKADLANDTTLIKETVGDAVVTRTIRKDYELKKEADIVDIKKRFPNAVQLTYKIDAKAIFAVDPSVVATKETVIIAVKANK